MTEITINLDQYNLLFENAAKFDMIVEAVKANIDKDDLYPVKEDEIMLLTGLSRYRHEHVQAMANRAQEKIGKKMPKPEKEPEEKPMGEALKEMLNDDQAEGQEHAENRTEL